MTSALSEMVARSTASGWILCLLVAGGLIKIFINQRPKMKELDIGQDGEIRAFFATQIEGLRSEILALREENTALRSEIRSLHGVIDGMRRENLQIGISTQRAVVQSLPVDFVPDGLKAALDRIEPVRKDAAE